MGSHGRFCPQCGGALCNVPKCAGRVVAVFERVVVRPPQRTARTYRRCASHPMGGGYELIGVSDACVCEPSTLSARAIALDPAVSDEHPSWDAPLSNRNEK